MQPDALLSSSLAADDYKLLSYDAAAAYLDITPVALRNKVYRGEGPVPTVIKRRTFFALCDLREYVQRHRRPSAATVRPVLAETSLAELMVPQKRRRGRPTIAETMARSGGEG